jgi:hypothetical protein
LTDVVRILVVEVEEALSEGGFEAALTASEIAKHQHAVREIANI